MHPASTSCMLLATSSQLCSTTGTAQQTECHVPSCTARLHLLSCPRMDALQKQEEKLVLESSCEAPFCPTASCHHLTDLNVT